MIRHIVIAAWRDLARSPLQSCIAIGGLAIGLTAVLAGIITANQYSYDHFIPGSKQVYYVGLESGGPRTADTGGSVTNVSSGSPLDLAKYLHQAIPEIAVTRLQTDQRHLRHGHVEASEELYWADPNVFQLLALPVLYGRLDKSLTRPDGIVIPRAIAEKYFGRDNVVGETLQLDRQHILTVTAVIADFPANAATLRASIFASGQAAFSTMAVDGAKITMGHDGSMSIHNSTTLVRIAPGLPLHDLERRASAMVDSFVPKASPQRRGLRFVSMDRLRVSPEIYPGFRPDFWFLMPLAC
jgi:putative ABC transport system permease protein